MNIRQLTEALMFRSRLSNVAGRTFGQKRDLYKALGYQRELFPPDYRSRFRRNAVANRVVKALPKGTWRGGAELIEDDDPNVTTTFEAAWDDLQERLKIWTVFARADILAGIGRYAVILIGAPGPLDTPLERCTADEIAYLTPFAEEDATIQAFDIDIKSPRFGRPVFYTVKRTSMHSTEAINSATIGRRVHFSRIIHIADGLLDDNIYGEPRLECVWNLLDDLEKVSGGGAEAYWRRADQGTHFDLDPTLDFDEPSKGKLRQQVDDFEHGLKRYLITRGVKVNALGSDVADIKNPVEAIISQISAGTGIPQRVLMGSEQGKLAAKMDRSNWDDRVSDRREDYASPMLVRPFVDRLISLGALPAPALYDVRWSQLKILDDEQRSVIAGEWANLNNLMQETVVTPDEIREHVLDLPPISTVAGVNPESEDIGPPEPTAASSKKGGAAKKIHRAADRFRTPRPTYRQRVLQRRKAQHQSKPAAPGAQGEERT
jgi:hypothetical protein